MANEEVTDKPDYLSPKEMRDWALQELRDSAKAHELRVRSATEIATEYAMGKLSPEEAHERMFQHEHRFGEAIPGTHAFVGSTDEQLLASIDKVRGKYVGDASFEERFGKRGERGGPPSR